MVGRLTPFIAVAGIPGAGKTTLARGLCRAYEYTGLISTGDIARRVDPAGLAAGGLADEDSFRAGWDERMKAVAMGWRYVLDGIPRSRGQMDLLPDDTTLIVLTCRPDIARDRLLRRGREDDEPDIVSRRITEQSALLEVEHADGWLYTAAGWKRTINTSRKSPEDILIGVIDYLNGVRTEMF